MSLATLMDTLIIPLLVMELTQNDFQHTLALGQKTLLMAMTQEQVVRLMPNFQ